MWKKRAHKWNESRDFRPECFKYILMFIDPESISERPNDDDVEEEEYTEK